MEYRTKLIIYIAILAVATAVITLIVLLAAREPSYQKPPALSQEELGIEKFTLKLPEAELLDLKPRFILLRQRFLKWSWEQVEKFFIDTDIILSEKLSQINQKKVENLLDSIP